MNTVIKNPSGALLARIFHCKTLIGLAGCLLVIAVAIIVNRLGLATVSDVHHWRAWLDAHAGDFFLCRLCLYFVIAYGGWTLRQYLWPRTASRAVRLRRLRIALAAWAVLLLLEVRLWL